ncbi:MAG: single-stranded-DNA-specific exonuclease RecJ [Fimbriimonadaceae bacterium]
MSETGDLFSELSEYDPLSRCLQWNLPKDNSALVEALLQECAVHPELILSRTACQLLVNRGITTAEAASRFLFPSLTHLHPPELLPDFEPANDLLQFAIRNNSKVYVHGDFDADGITSSAIIHRALKSLGIENKVFIPHRFEDGYGVSTRAIEEARDWGAEIFFTCDCGITANEAVEYAKSQGMKVLVSDHHQPQGAIPDALAVVNPHREDSEYPFRQLCGAGVAYKLLLGVVRRFDPSYEAPFHKNFLELAALGTIADVMPLIDENRVIVALGLQHLSQTRRPGLRALFRYSEFTADQLRDLDAVDVSFRVVPRINAVGRLGDPHMAFQLLTTSSETEADLLARRVDEINRQRRTMTEEIFREADQMIAAQPTLDPFLIISSSTWSKGLLGLVAGRLREKYARPAFVGLSDEISGTVSGSVRSIPGFNIAEVIERNRPLIDGGGHVEAAGLSFSLDSFEAVRTLLITEVMTAVRPEELVPSCEIEVELNPDDFNSDLVQNLWRFRPFGKGNEPPIVLMKSIQLSGLAATSKPEHYKFEVKTQEKPIRGIGFKMGPRLKHLPQGTAVDLVGTLTFDRYNGNVKLQFELLDFQALN